MSMSLPAFRGKFGSTEFFLCTMYVGEFTQKVRIPKELPGWDDLTPEEKWQRDVNYNRVKKQIAPYLATDPDRFIGAFIVAINNYEDNVFFSPLSKAGLKFPDHMHKQMVEKFGVLQLSGQETLVPLDGQHRLAALRMAIDGKDERGADLDFSSGADLADDTVSVILIRHEPQKARKIFNKVNRYAKAVSKNDNIITSEDDIAAVIARKEVCPNLIPINVVNLESNTLSAKMGKFTTLNVIYEINVHLIEQLFLEGKKKLDTSKLPSDADCHAMTSCVLNFWKDFLTVESFAGALIDTSADGNSVRGELLEGSCIHKPIIQRALAEAIVRLRIQNERGAPNLTMNEILSRINQIDWSTDNSVWHGVLMDHSGSKVISGAAAMKFAARMIAYKLGEDLDHKELENLRDLYQRNNPKTAFPERDFTS